MNKPTRRKRFNLIGDDGDAATLNLSAMATIFSSSSTASGSPSAVNRTRRKRERGSISFQDTA